MKCSSAFRLLIAAAALVLSLWGVVLQAANAPTSTEAPVALTTLQTMLDSVATGRRASFSLRPEVTEPQRSLFRYIVSGNPADSAVENAYRVLFETIGRQSIPLSEVFAYSWLAQPDDPEPRTTQVLLHLIANTNNCGAVGPLGNLVEQRGNFSRTTDMTFLLQALRARPAGCNADQVRQLIFRLYGLDKYDEPLAESMISAAELTWGREASLDYRRMLARNYFELLDADDLQARVDSERLSWPVREMAVDALAQTRGEDDLIALVDSANYPLRLRLALVDNLGGASINYRPKRASRSILEHLASHSNLVIRNHFLRGIRTINRGSGTAPLWDYLELGIGPGSNTETRNIVLGKLNAFVTRMEPNGHRRALRLALTLSTDPDPTVRFNVIQVLGAYAIALRQLPPQLCVFRDDAEPVIRDAAAFWLSLARYSVLAPNDPVPDPNRCDLDNG